MTVFSGRIVKAYVIPAAVFQSVNIGGGYATGRELVEFFTQYGPVGGVIALVLATVLLGIILAGTYEFARVFQAYDYRSFFRHLIGPFWRVFEVLYLTTAMVALAVVASASGKITADIFKIPESVGIIGMVVLVGLLSFFGRTLIKRVLTLWSAVLYAVLALYVVLMAMQHAPEIANTLASGDILPGWMLGGATYAWFSAAAIPSVLFALRDIQTRHEAVVSGFCSALFFITPAFLFHLSFLAIYPAVVSAELPVYETMALLAMPALVSIYTIVLFGTLVETSAGIAQAVNERIDGALIESRGTPATRRTHLAVGALGLTLCILLSQFGIVALVAKGYALLSWGFLLVYIAPLFTIGIVKMRGRASRTGDAG